MSLLSEIQDSAVDGSSDLETLLRKCRVLATRLKHEDLKNWVACELDGYPADMPLPEYRTCSGHPFGTFVGALGRGVKNCPIPISDIPEEFRDVMTHQVFRQGVGALQNLVGTVEGTTIQFGWPAEANQIIRPKNMANDLVLAQGWLNVDKSRLVGILSTVRNRILGFALELEALYPDAEEANPGKTPLSKEEVNRVFQQNITQIFHGHVANVASGHAIEQTGTINIQQGDFRTLAMFLQEKGVSDEDIRDLESAIKADPRPEPSGKTLGKKVAAWVGKMIAKSAEGAWKAGTDAASKLLIDAIKNHYGMHL
jgi:AbiTii